MEVIVLSVKVEVCSVCGCRLAEGNRSIDAELCKDCFKAEMADIQAEDEFEDSMTDAERMS